MEPASIRRYRLRSSNKSVEELFAEINDAWYRSNGPDYRFGASRIIANPLQAYERFLSAFRRRADVEFLTFRRLFAAPRRKDTLQVVIRHDVDMDLPAALRQAEIEHGLGVVSTYFFLHTAHYHGLFDENVFNRHECVKHVYARVQTLGHEVGVHNDALHVYQNQNMNGADALVTELEWMRSSGLDVVGTAAHNYLPSYGAENYEIFKGRYYRRELEPSHEWKPQVEGDYKREDEVRFDGKVAPLRVLDEAELGLEYEANDAFRHGDGPIEYGATRFLNLWRWNMHIERYKQDPTPPNTYFIDEDTVIEDILALAPGTLLILTVHPVYYGCRYSAHRTPPLRRHDLTSGVNPVLGWETYVPERVQCCLKEDGIDTRQSINMSNEHGMLDGPWPDEPEKADLRILVLGGENVDGRHLGIDGHCHALLESFLKDTLKKHVVVRKLAFPGMGISRLISWYEKTRAVFNPHVVLIGIDGFVLRKNLPEVWARGSGFSASHPPGAYLSRNPHTNSFETIEPSSAWAIHQMKPRPTLALPTNGHDLVAPLTNGESLPVAGSDAKEYVEELYRFTIEQIRGQDAKPALFMEGLGSLPDGQGGRTPIDADSEAGITLRARFQEMAGRLGVLWIDPYQAFLADTSNRRPTHTDGLWTFAGQRLAAEEMFRVLSTDPIVSRSKKNGGQRRETA